MALTVLNPTKKRERPSRLFLFFLQSFLFLLVTFLPLQALIHSSSLVSFFLLISLFPLLSLESFPCPSHLFITSLSFGDLSFFLLHVILSFTSVASSLLLPSLLIYSFLAAIYLILNAFRRLSNSPPVPPLSTVSSVSYLIYCSRCGKFVSCAQVESGLKSLRTDVGIWIGNECHARMCLPSLTSSSGKVKAVQGNPKIYCMYFSLTWWTEKKYHTVLSNFRMVCYS